MIQEINDFVRRVAQGIERAVRQPRSELDRWGRAVRFVYDLSRVGALQLKEDRASEMAGALAFRTLFALAPVLVVVTILVRAIAGVDEFMRIVGSLLDAAGMADVRVVFPGASDAGGAVHAETLKDWMSGIVEQTTHVTLSTVGWVGFAMIVYSAISLLSTIESSFNVIYRAPRSRRRSRSIPLYWFLLTVSPLVISLASYLHGQVAAWGAALAWNEWTTVWISFAWNWLVTWAGVTMIFILVPNTNVSFRPALAGALLTVFLLELGKRTFGQYLASSFEMSQLVSSLGLIPLFMFWVYLMWFAVLFGLEVSAILQQLGRRNLEEMERATESIEIVDPAVVVTLMQMIAREFRLGHSTSLLQLVRETRLSQRQVEIVLRKLVAADLLHRLDGSESMVCLARPPDEIAATALLEIGFGLSDLGPDNGPSTVVERLRAAQRTVATNWTLAALEA